MGGEQSGSEELGGEQSGSEELGGKQPGSEELGEQQPGSGELGGELSDQPGEPPQSVGHPSPPPSPPVARFAGHGSKSRISTPGPSQGDDPAASTEMAKVVSAPHLMLKWRRKARVANDRTAYQRWSVERIRQKVSHVRTAIEERDAGRTQIERLDAQRHMSRFASATFQAQLQAKLNEMRWRPEWEYRTRLTLAWLFNF
eukprot:CAMPEP_0174712440 /NCGR_PEP_ID=MMETSP1094-20130205/13431_1 /TAXON_ID=156173 /ORGANISM="Chrysochromulina brevifilum, Strain UTEX LB 985" /LENGTH=199 /DNA_ID=CAMNT_0015911507 /DNA_START=3 /DNA_END=599 /DNA_ORIENTATION=-